MLAPVMLNLVPSNAAQIGEYLSTVPFASHLNSSYVRVYGAPFGTAEGGIVASKLVRLVETHGER